MSFIKRLHCYTKLITNIQKDTMERNTTILAAACLFISLLFFAACGGGNGKTDTADQSQTPTPNAETADGRSEVHGDMIKDGDITFGSSLDAAMVAEGEKTYQLKCQSCHRLSGEKLVGPGWKDVTKRRKPAWIMNMITNVDMMLDSDPEAQKLFEQCLVRMPNQNITREDAREVLEFMRSNDGEK